MKADYYYTNQAPTANDDVDSGFAIGKTWHNTTASAYDVYRCTSNASGAAVWFQENNIVQLKSVELSQNTPEGAPNTGYFEPDYPIDTKFKSVDVGKFKGK